MKGEVKGDAVATTLRTIIGYGIERTELRDEIYCQLMRQTNDNHHPDSVVRGWNLFALCCVSFSPSHTLKHVSSLYHTQMSFILQATYD